MITHAYGFIRDIFDPSPTYTPHSVKNPVGILSSMDFSAEMPEVYNQLSIGSCQSNALGACIQYTLKSPNIPSRLFLYYNARKLMGTINQDSGSTMQAVYQGAQRFGVCNESLWPYITPPNDGVGITIPVQEMYVCPPMPVYTAAAKDLLVRMESLTSTDAIKHALSNKIPITFGMEVYSYFESAYMASTGMLQMPGPTDSLIGGHALVIVGFDDAKKLYKIRNSWGTNWGLNGYFYAPYAYIENPSLAFQFSAVLAMEE
jgi:C1A family cysteine protease